MCSNQWGVEKRKHIENRKELLFIYRPIKYDILILCIFYIKIVDIYCTENSAASYTCTSPRSACRSTQNYFYMNVCWKAYKILEYTAHSTYLTRYMRTHIHTYIHACIHTHIHTRYNTFRFIQAHIDIYTKSSNFRNRIYSPLQIKFGHVMFLLRRTLECDTEILFIYTFIYLTEGC
jgi:hypothetical protein